jgi:hypothetical protein
VTEGHPFQLLPDRLAGLPIDQTLHDGVPDWLDQPLRDWIVAVMTDQGDEGAERLARRVLMRLRWAKDNPQQHYLERLGFAGNPEVLTVVDALLQLHPSWGPQAGIAWSIFEQKLAGLEGTLVDGESLYRIDLSGRCLVRRVDTTVQATVDAAIVAATSTAADYLRTAWVAAYGINPDPDKAL